MLLFFQLRFFLIQVRVCMSRWENKVISLSTLYLSYLKTVL